MSLQSTYNSVKGVIADNLVSMGVNASQSDGLTTLANKILDIEPSIGGLDLDTAISLTTPTSALVGQSVVLKSKLTATYDDETVVDVDLSGVLQNATVKFYDGTTLIGTSTTGLDGVVSINYSYSTVGTHSLKAVFEGTENYDECTSSIVQVTVTAPVVGSIDLVSDKSILSYFDSDTATLTATVYDDSASALPMEDVGVYFKIGEQVIGYDVSDSNGEATCTLNSYGSGDISVTAEVGMIVSETYGIEDCYKYDSNTYTSTTTPNIPISTPNKIQIEFDFTKGANNSGAFTSIGDDTNNCLQVGLLGSGTYGFWLKHNGSNVTQQTLGSLPNGTFTTIVTYDNGSINVKINNQTFTYTYTQPLTKILQYAPWNNGNIKNIKVKAL